ATRGVDANPLGAELHRGLDGTLEGAAERDAALELLADVLGHELRVDLGLADLLDVQEDLGFGHLLDFALERFDARAALADDDAGARGEDVDLHLVRGALDRDLRDARAVELALEVAAQAKVLVEPLTVARGLEPLRVPGLDDLEAEANRMCFLAHSSCSSGFGGRLRGFDFQVDVARLLEDSGCATVGAR